MQTYDYCLITTHISLQVWCFFIAVNPYRVRDTFRYSLTCLYWYKYALRFEVTLNSKEYKFYTISLSRSKLTICHLLTENRIMVPTFITCRLLDLLAYTSCPFFYKEEKESQTYQHHWLITKTKRSNKLIIATIKEGPDSIFKITHSNKYTI